MSILTFSSETKQNPTSFYFTGVIGMNLTLLPHPDHGCLKEFFCFTLVCIVSLFCYYYFFFKYTFLCNQLQLPFQADLIMNSLFVSYTFILLRKMLFCTNKLLNWELWENLVQKKYTLEKMSHMQNGSWILVVGFVISFVSYLCFTSPGAEFSYPV